MTNFYKIVFAFILVFLMLPESFEAQQRQRQRSQVSITQSYVIQKIDSIKSVLFVFKGKEVFADMYIDLSKRLRMRFKKRFPTGFQYQLTSEKGTIVSPEWIPKNSNGHIKHNLLCKVSVYGLQLSRNKHDPKTYHNYTIDMEMIDPTTNELIEFAKLEVTSSSTAFLNNRAVVKLMDKIITK